jgi:ABC-2 type transport system permease protein
MSAFGRIFGVARVEWLRLIRAPMTFTLLLIVPAMQVLLFGYAIRPTSATVSVAIAAPSHATAQKIAAVLAKQAELTIVSSSLKSGQAESLVRSRGVLIGIELPEMRSFANPFAPQKPLRIIVDGTNATLTAAAVPKIEAAYWREIVARADASDSGPGLKIERLYNPDQRADWTFLPALIGVTVMISMIMLGTLSLAREREGGTWEALLAMPIGAAETLLGKLLPYTVIGLVQGTVVLVVGISLFDLPTHGSVAALVLVLPLFAAAHLVLGYAISTRAATQVAALQGAVAFYLPAMLLSGFLYPFETLPHWAQIIGNFFPLTHFIKAAQGAFLRGDLAADTFTHAVPICAFLAGVTGLAIIAHARRLD